MKPRPDTEASDTEKIDWLCDTVTELCDRFLPLADKATSSPLARLALGVRR